MKKILAKIVPHIIPEFLLFLTKILPLGILLAVTIFSLKAYNFFQSPFKMFLIGTLTCVAGIYVMRITAYAIKTTLIKIQNIIPDIYYDESLNKKS